MFAEAEVTPLEQPASKEVVADGKEESKDEQKVGQKRTHSESSNGDEIRKGNMRFDYQKLVDQVDEAKLMPLLEQKKKFKFMVEGVGRKI